ncbi:MAG: hypothetical protein VST67_05810, partial [Nitrospirota bacterium]|nr:hypothetical protein [Nitrospirota bacterium]
MAIGDIPTKKSDSGTIDRQCSIGPVEYLYPMAQTCPRRNRHEPLTGMFKKHVLAEAGSPSSKAAALLARGAY